MESLNGTQMSSKSLQKTSYSSNCYFPFKVLRIKKWFSRWSNLFSHHSKWPICDVINLAKGLSINDVTQIFNSLLINFYMLLREMTTWLYLFAATTDVSQFWLLVMKTGTWLHWLFKVAGTIHFMNRHEYRLLKLVGDRIKTYTANFGWNISLL